MSLSMLKAAFAGLVEGSFTASIHVVGKIYFMYILCDNAPLQKMRSTRLLSSITERSFGTTSLTELSDEPVIVQEWDRIPHRDMVLQHKRLLLFDRLRVRFLKQCRHQLPEAVLRMAVEEHRLSGFDRRKRAEDQYFAVFII